MDAVQRSSHQTDAKDLARRVALQNDASGAAPASSREGRPAPLGAPSRAASTAAQASFARASAPLAGFADADTILPPPKAPSVPVTPRTEAAFASLSRSIDDVLGTLSEGAPAIDWTALTPEVPHGLSPELAGPRAKSMARAAAHAVGEAGRQFALMHGSDQFVAFMMLRLEAHSHGLHVNQQLADMASAVRHTQLTEQQMYDKEAAALLDRAVAQQAKLERAGLWLGGMTALVASSLAILMTTSGVGLALTVGSIGLGFLAGGALGGREDGRHFDFNSAFQGATLGASVVPLLETLGFLYGAIGRLAAPVTPVANGDILEGIASFFAAQSPSALLPLGQRVVGAFEVMYERYILAIMNSLGPQTRMALWAVDPIMRSVSGIYQTTALYRTTQIELQGQTQQSLGKMCAQAGKQAQERWKNTLHFLSGMQESHNDAVEQVMRIMSLHHQTLTRTASYIA